MNIKPISFNGTFCVNQAKMNSQTARRIIQKQERYQITIQPGNYINPEERYLTVPDYMDAAFEKFLTRLKLPYRFVDAKEALSHKSITSRMRLSGNSSLAGNFLKRISLEKLDNELQKDLYSYIGSNGINGSKTRYDRFKKYLLTNQEIEAPDIYLRREENGNISTHVYDGRHRLAVFRDLGLESIPVGIDKDSLELAKEINLI